MSLKSALKKLASIGAHTIVAGLRIGGGEVGDVAADLLAKTLKLDKLDPKFTQKLERLAGTEDGRRLILEAEQKFKIASHELFNEDTLAKIQAEVAMFTETQVSYRAELLTKDKYISHTRPWLVRTAVKLGLFIMGSLFLAWLGDVSYVTWLSRDCNDACYEFLKTRPTFVGWLSSAYLSQQAWTMALFTAVVAFVGGRTYEKSTGVAV